MNRIPRSLCAVSVAFLLASQANAQLSNGDFSSGLTSWTSYGDASAVSGSAFLTTAASNGSDDASALNVSGSAPLEANIVSGLEESSGLAIGALDISTSATAVEGSAISQTFSFASGLTQLSFDYNFFTNEGDNLDYAYFAINGTKVSFATAASAATASSAYAFETGVQNAVQVFTSSGTVTLTFGVVDINGFDVSSAVSIDNIGLTAIPEPSAFATLAGSLALGFVALRRRRSV